MRNLAESCSQTVGRFCISCVQIIRLYTARLDSRHAWVQTKFLYTRSTRLIRRCFHPIYLLVYSVNLFLSTLSTRLTIEATNQINT